MPNPPDAKPGLNSGGDWRRNTLIAIVALTLFRLLTLWISPTELYVDEAQYWLWGQYPDFGYFSKPPLIGWLIGAVTTLVGSDSAFWVRMPAPLLHGITAAILAYWTRTSLLRDSPDAEAAAFWVALTYLTLPIATVGSFVISTDTVMAPFLAGALAAYWRLLARPSSRLALLVGVLIGLAMMAKYAAIYVFIGMALAAVFSRDFRLHPKYAALIALATLVVLAPNILWNVTHDLATLSHTADNASWVGGAEVELLPLGPLMFLAGQAAVFGPVMLGVLIVVVLRLFGPGRAALVAFALPPLLVVGGQSLLADVNANWTFVACLSAIPLCVLWLRQRRAQRVLLAGVLVNGLLVVGLPLMTLVPERIVINDRHLLSRYFGHSAVAQQFFAAADAANATAILAGNRSILADLFYHRDPADTRPIYSTYRLDTVKHYYAQTFPLPKDVVGPVLYIARGDPALTCQIAPPRVFEVVPGAYQRRPAPKGYLIPNECLGEVAHDAD